MRLVMHFERRQRGMSIPEMMIGLLLSSMILAGLMGLFVQSRRSFRQDEIIARMQEDARFAVSSLQQDISMAGFWADLLDPSGIQNEGTLAGGGDVYIYTTPMYVEDNVGGGETLLGEDLDDIVAGTDAIALVKVEGGRSATASTDAEIPTAAAELDEDGVYLRTNGVIGRMSTGSEAPTAANAIPTAYSFWEYAPVIYWVRSYATTAGDGIPTLCRKILSGGAMTTECIAQGVEDMQVELGVDTDGDDYADQYVSAPTAAQMALVTSVRIYILGRALTEDETYTNSKTYTYSNSAIAPDNPGDGFYRRVYTTTIMVRNNAHYMNLTS